MSQSNQRYQDKLIEDVLKEQLIVIYDEVEDDRDQGILRQIQGNGFDSLSIKQTYRYNNFIEPILNSRFRECLGCSQTINTVYATEINVSARINTPTHPK